MGKLLSPVNEVVNVVPKKPRVIMRFPVSRAGRCRKHRPGHFRLGRAGCGVTALPESSHRWLPLQPVLGVHRACARPPSAKNGGEKRQSPAGQEIVLYAPRAKWPERGICVRGVTAGRVGVMLLAAVGFVTQEGQPHVFVVRPVLVMTFGLTSVPLQDSRAFMSSCNATKLSLCFWQARVHGSRPARFFFEFSCPLFSFNFDLNKGRHHARIPSPPCSKVPHEEPQWPYTGLGRGKSPTPARAKNCSPVQPASAKPGADAQLPPGGWLAGTDGQSLSGGHPPGATRKVARRGSETEPQPETHSLRP
jgi:hypothetical protein